MTYAILWTLCPIVWAGGTAVWPMLLLILGHECCVWVATTHMSVEANILSK